MFYNIRNSPKNKTIYFDSPIKRAIFALLLERKNDNNKT